MPDQDKENQKQEDASMPIPGRKRSPLVKAKFVKAVLAGSTYKDAAIAAGYAPRSAGVKAVELKRDPDIKAALERALDRAGATIDATARVVFEAHNATKQVGLGESATETADHYARLKAAELNCKIRKIVGSGDIGQQTQVNIFNTLDQALQQRGLL